MKETVALSRLFWKAWVKNPREVGAVLPSGRMLATSMADQVEPGPGMVVELGAGTGAVTRTMLDRGIPPSQLVAIEKSPAMAANLENRFPGIRVLRGDAAHLSSLIRDSGIPQPATVVSSLPLLSLPWRKRLRVLKGIAINLPLDGRLVQFTYSPRPPIKTSIADALGFEGKRVDLVAFNLPPATVWVYIQKRETATKSDSNPLTEPPGSSLLHCW